MSVSHGRACVISPSRRSPTRGLALPRHTALALAILSSLLIVALPAKAQVGAATCTPAGGSVPAGQIRADNTTRTLASGTYTTTISGAPTLLALNGGAIQVTGPITAVSTAANTATVCSTSAGTVGFNAAGSTISRTAAGGPAVRIEAGSSITSLGTSYYTALGQSEGIGIVGGSFSGSSDQIVTGVKLGTLASNPTTFGRPVDASGALVTDPNLYVSNTATQSYGISANGATVRINVDSSGAALPGTSTSILTIGAGAAATTGSYGIFATNGSTVRAANLFITTRNNNNWGASIASGSSFVGTGVNISTSGIAAHGLQTSGTSSQTTLTNFTVGTLGQNAYGLYALSGGQITLDSPGSTVIAAGQTGSALRAEGAGSQIMADGLRLSTLRNGGVGAQALVGGGVNLADTTIYSSGISGGNSAIGMQAATGGRLIYNGGTIVTGALLGADPTLPTYGLPVDGSGNAVSTISQYVASGTTGANGLQIATTGGSAWINVDSGTGAPTGAASTIDTFGNNSGGMVVSQNAVSTSSISAANVTVTTRGTSSPGVLVQGTAGSTGPVGTFSDMRVVTAGSSAPDFFAQAGASITVNDSTLITTGSSNGIRSDGATSVVTANRLSVSTLGISAPALNATGGTLKATDSVVLTAGRGSHGMTLSANAGTPGTLVMSGGSITTGVLLGTDATLSTFAQPVDGTGNRVTDPTQYAASGGTGHGVFSTTSGGRTWINVDPATSAIGGTSTSILTLGDTSEGLDIQGAADQATLANTQITTRGGLSYGMRANNGGLITVTGGSVNTGGTSAYGLAAFADGTVSAHSVPVTTTGNGAHGLMAFSSNSSVTIDSASSVSVSGQNAHGAVAWNGGVITGNSVSVSAQGSGGMAAFVNGDAAASSMSFAASTLSSTGGPGIGVAGNGAMTLTGTTVTGNGLWLRVGSVDDFTQLAVIPPDPPEDTTPQPEAVASPLALAVAAVGGQASVTASAAVLNGAALTVLGSTSDVLLNQGTVWNMTGSSNVTNLTLDHSSILFGPPTGDITEATSYHTLTTMNFTSASGLLRLNTYLGGDASPSDVLVMDGGSATGDATLQVLRSGGLGAVTSGDGIRVVQSVNGATTTTGMFALAAKVVAGPYEYFLYRGGNEASVQNDWFLRNTVDCTAEGAPVPPCPPSQPPAPPGPPAPPAPPGPPAPPAPPAPPEPPVPFFRPEVSLYAALPALAMRYGWATLGNLHERVGDEQTLAGRDDLWQRTTFNGAWVRLIGEDGQVDGSKDGIYGLGPHYDYNQVTLQGGMDIYAKEHDNNQRDLGGVYLADGRVASDVNTWNGTDAGRDVVKAQSLGLYWTHYWQEGAYLDAVLQGSWYKASAKSVDAEALKYANFGWAASLEGGYPFHFDTQVLEPQLQVVYQDINDSEGTDTAATVRFNNVESLAARAGLRWANTWTLEPSADGTPRLFVGWLRLNLWKEFKGQPQTAFSSESGFIPFNSSIKGSWWQLNGGTTWQLSRRTSFYANLGYQKGFGSRGFHAWDGKIGLRWNW